MFQFPSYEFVRVPFLAYIIHFWLTANREFCGYKTEPVIKTEKEGRQSIPNQQKRKMTDEKASKKVAMLAVSDDPFAPREGKTLLWKNVNMTLVSLPYC